MKNLGTPCLERTRPERCFCCGGSALVEPALMCRICGAQPWDPHVVRRFEGESGCDWKLVYRPDGSLVRGDLPDPPMPAQVIEVFELLPPRNRVGSESTYGARIGHLYGLCAPHPDLAVTQLRVRLDDFLASAKECPGCGSRHSVMPYNRMQDLARCDLGCGAIFSLEDDGVGSWRPACRQKATT